MPFRNIVSHEVSSTRTLANSIVPENETKMFWNLRMSQMRIVEKTKTTRTTWKQISNQEIGIHEPGADIRNN